VLTARSISGIDDLSYGYDLTNNITSMLDTLETNGDQTFTYDKLSRLLTWMDSYGYLGFSYDKIGNRLTKTENTATDIYIYAPGSHRLTAVTGANPSISTHDAAGNTLTKGDLIFTYNQQGRLITASKTGMIANYRYNFKGKRSSKSVNGVTTHFIYDMQGQLIAEADNNGTIQKEYIYVNGQLVASVDAGTLYYVHTDHLGTPIAMTDEAGMVQWKAHYAPFGKAVIVIGNIVQNIRLPGQYYDEETGLHYNYFRYYDPETGRYITSDPIGLQGGLNTYSYVGGNPLMFIDPFGLAGCYVGYPGYPITIPGTSTKIPLTHAGVLSYDAQGHTRYYEYGRYDSNFGEVKRRTVPDLEMGPDGKPTPESWRKLIEALNKIGHGTEAKTSCDDKADADKINDFAERRMNDPNRAPYSWNPFNFNTCTTFANDAMGAGLK